AKRMDAIVDRGDPLPPLGGVPIAIKDVMVMQAVELLLVPKFLATTFRLMIARQYRGWNRLVRSFWENSIVMSSLWDRRTKIQPGDQYAIHETSAGCPEVPVEALLPALLPVPRWPPW